MDGGSRDLLLPLRVLTFNPHAYHKEKEKTEQARMEHIKEYTFLFQAINKNSFVMLTSDGQKRFDDVLISKRKAKRLEKELLFDEKDRMYSFHVHFLSTGYMHIRVFVFWNSFS